MIYEVIVPQLGVNDEKIIISEWFVENNEQVKVDQKICTVETAKSTFEVNSQFNGYIKIIVPEFDEVAFDQCIAIITDSSDIKVNLEHYRNKDQVNDSDDTLKKHENNWTNKAYEYAIKHSFNIETIKKDGLITIKDIKKHLNDISKLEKGEVKGEEANISKKKIKESNCKYIALYGIGLGAMTAKEYLEEDGIYEIAYYVDDFTTEKYFDSVPILKQRDLQNVKDHIVGVACFVADNKFRLKIKELVDQLGLELISIISKRASLRESTKLGKGLFIKDGAVIGMSCMIDDCCIIDNNVTIAHHCHIEEGCFLAPGATVGGGTKIGKASVLAISSSVVSKVNIGENVIVSAGSSVHSDILNNNIVEGIPARIIGRTKNIKDDSK